MTSRRYVTLCRAAGLLLGAAAIPVLFTRYSPMAVLLGTASACLFWRAREEAAADRRARVAARRAELAARPCPPPPDGRPLDARERAALADIAAHYDHGTAA
ncbi:hypothetical protein GPA10_24885 [Streptomyces sp. p1417]|uniref:Uncharacterized protein n=1 Tax=Streptomyces typhae TaxID=2681492 RepID=A0A6L6X248_9ACTN|nr:hypothetical protein [Streptomyces typhae]MVO87904.1 hypothetical protein [Streptomyces typhae]